MLWVSFVLNGYCHFRLDTANLTNERRRDAGNLLLFICQEILTIMCSRYIQIKQNDMTVYGSNLKLMKECQGLLSKTKVLLCTVLAEVVFHYNFMKFVYIVSGTVVFCYSSCYKTKLVLCQWTPLQVLLYTFRCCFWL